MVICNRMTVLGVPQALTEAGALKQGTTRSIWFCLLSGKVAPVEFLFLERKKTAATRPSLEKPAMFSILLLPHLHQTLFDIVGILFLGR